MGPQKTKNQAIKPHETLKTENTENMYKIQIQAYNTGDIQLAIYVIWKLFPSAGICLSKKKKPSDDV